MKARLSDCNPLLGMAFATKDNKPVWELSMDCPFCGERSSINVSGRDPVHPVWQIEPDPLLVAEGKAPAGWDHVTVKPSVSNIPHSRQSTCAQRHFSITKGAITP